MALRLLDQARARPSSLSPEQAQCLQYFKQVLAEAAVEMKPTKPDIGKECRHPAAVCWGWPPQAATVNPASVHMCVCSPIAAAT